MRPRPGVMLGLLALVWPGVALAQADLLGTSLSITPTSGVPGTAVTATYRVRNGGSSDASAFTVGFYFSDNTAITTSDTLLQQVALGALAAGASYPATQSGQVSLILPAGASPGTHYIGLLVDSGDTVAESNEGNNTLAAAVVVQAPPPPDLVISALSVSPSSGVPGGEVTATYRLRNTGSGDAGPFVSRFYYSEDSILDASDSVLSELNLASLAAGAFYPASQSGQVTLTLPAEATPGTRYLWLRVDDAGAVSESNESNNSSTTLLTVLVAYPDLLLESFVADDSAAGLGSSVHVEVTVRNQGAGGAGPTRLRLAYGDSDLDSGLISLLELDLAALTAGASASYVADLTLPGEVLHGSRRLHYLLDPEATILESSVANNRGSRPLEITGLPDLRVTALSLDPAGQLPGALVNVRHRVRNAGVSRTPDACVLRFYSSVDAAIDTGDSYLDVERVIAGALAAGAYDPRDDDALTEVVVPGGAAPGALYLGALVDDSGVIPEADEGNNARVAELTVLAAAGAACAAAATCASGWCVDGRCCDGPCGGDNPSDCLACSVAAGAVQDGVCAPRATGQTCGSDVDTVCDAADRCDGAGVCQANLAPSTTLCRPGSGCDPAEFCNGLGACPDDVRAAPGCCVAHDDCEQPAALCAEQVCAAVLCRACAEAADCGVAGNRCVAMPSGAFCAYPCEFGAADACPPTYRCRDLDGEDLCLPAVGDCQCTPEVRRDCAQGDLYWLDSCGLPGELVEDCEGRGCAAGACCVAGAHLEGEDCVDDAETGCGCAATAHPGFGLVVLLALGLRPRRPLARRRPRH